MSVAPRGRSSTHIDGRAQVKRLTLLLATALVIAVTTPSAIAQQPTWVAELGYRPSEVFPIHRGYLGMPFVEVAISDSAYWLLFDTGNMVGLTLATPLLDKLRLDELGRWNRRDSDGRVIGTYRRVRAPVVRLLGYSLTDQTIFEFGDTATFRWMSRLESVCFDGLRVPNKSTLHVEGAAADQTKSLPWQASRWRQGGSGATGRMPGA
jgi:hypothetical protein